jgi:hypothetical protein
VKGIMALTKDSGDRSYYQGQIECKDAIAAATKHLQGIEAFYVGNCIKYLWRLRQKDQNPTEDIIKAQTYLRFLLEHVQKSLTTTTNQDTPRTY